MTQVIGPICFMVAALAVLLGTAGLLSWPFVWRVVLGSAALLLTYAGAMGTWVAHQRKRVVTPSKPVRDAYIYATAKGLIREGDLVKVDMVTYRCERVVALLPVEPGTPVQ